MSDNEHLFNNFFVSILNKDFISFIYFHSFKELIFHLSLKITFFCYRQHNHTFVNYQCLKFYPRMWNFYYCFGLHPYKMYSQCYHCYIKIQNQINDLSNRDLFQIRRKNQVFYHNFYPRQMNMESISSHKFILVTWIIFLFLLDLYIDYSVILTFGGILESMASFLVLHFGNSSIKHC